MKSSKQFFNSILVNLTILRSICIRNKTYTHYNRYWKFSLLLLSGKRSWFAPISSFSFQFRPSKSLNSYFEVILWVMWADCNPKPHIALAPATYLTWAIAVINSVTLFPVLKYQIWVTHWNNECSCMIAVWRVLQ